jgi:tRNA pseudouridine55 synthase
MIDKNVGFVNIIKPTGMTSSDVVLKVKKILKQKRVGHLGTLDPAASGVLPIAVGKATKFFDYFLNKDKVYVARVRFGIETDTLDSFGNITNINNKTITAEMLESVIPNFTGDIFQVPPKFSSVKIDGKRAYDLARENINFEIKPKKISIFSIKVMKNCEKNDFLFEVHCSAGTYIRTLFADIAKSLETVATVSVIIRKKSGCFEIDDALTLEEFEKEPKIKTIQETLNKLKTIELDEKFAKKILNGVRVNSIDFGLTDDISDDFLIEYKGKLVGLYSIKNGLIEPKVFLYEE